MKKSSLKKTCITGLVVGLAVMPGLAAAAENWTYTGTASDRLNIDGTNNAIGPKDLTNVTGNTITVNYTSDGSNEVSYFFGGYNNSNLDVSGNTANLSNGIMHAGQFGGWSYKGNVTNNRATIGSGTIYSDVVGGYSYSVGDVTGNTVLIGGGTVDGNAYGGYSEGSFNVNHNSVTISGGTVNSDVYGAWVDNGVNSTGNSVIINEDNAPVMVGGNVYGSFANLNSVEGNSVTMDGGTVGGYVSGGRSLHGSVNTNNVAINGGKVQGDVYGGLSFSSNQSSAGNSVTVTGGQVSGVYGGYSTDGAAGNNTVDISGGKVENAVLGGYTNNGAASGNSVYISGGRMGGLVGGGMSINGDATDNSVTISGGKFYGDIYGGYSTARNATGNSITISGSPLLASAMLYGGYTGGLIGDAFTGNTLNVKSSGMTVKGVANFQKYNFYLPEDVANGDSMLAVTSTANISNSTIGVGINGPTTALHPGDRVTLLATGGLTAAGINSRAVGLQGIARMYDFDLTTDVNNLYATVTGSPGPDPDPGPRLNPQTKALSEGQISAAAFLNQGADILSGQGLQNAQSAANGAGGQASGFAAMGGSKLRYETGSHVNVNGFSLVLGAARQIAGADSTSVSGLFLENGWGSYSTYNDFVNAASVRGDGNTRYFGAGWLGRYQKNDGRYMEGSLRFGKVNNEFNSNDIGIAGTNSRFDISAPYYGMHVGFGKETDSGNNKKQDVYTKLLWTHQNGSNASVQGDEFDFGAINSYRWQLGTKWLCKTNEHTTLRTGLAYQYEFSGKVNATVNDTAIDAPSMKGSTGIVEVGLTQESKDGKGAKLDFGLQGFFGKMRGLAGNVQATWNF